MTSNFIKEIFWKNDLTYLCLTFPLVLFLIKDKPIILISAFFIIISLMLTFSWYTSLKKRYIFNSSIKIPIVLCALIITSLQFFPVENSLFKFINSVMVMLFFSFYSFYVVLNAYCFHQNADEYHEGEYHPEYEDSYREDSYKRSIYSIMKWNNTIEYHYDKNIDVYLYDGAFYENIVHYLFGFGVSSPISHSGMVAIGDVGSYIDYLHETGLTANKVTTADLEVFKMLMI